MHIFALEQKAQELGFATAKFNNKHGEKFTLVFDEISVWIGGDETNHQAINLFNSSFNVYNKEELLEIGKFLIEVAKSKKR